MQKSFLIGVFGLAVNIEGKFLLTQRHQPGSEFHLKWQLPGGGVEFGETLEQALFREFQEETCTTPKLKDPQPINTITTLKANTHLLLVIYLVDIEDQEIDITQDLDQETCDFGWFSYDEALQLDLIPGVKGTLKKSL